MSAALDFQLTIYKSFVYAARASQSAAHVLPAKGETAFARPHARMVEKRSLVFPPSHTQVDWRLFVEGGGRGRRRRGGAPRGRLWGRRRGGRRRGRGGAGLWVAPLRGFAAGAPGRGGEDAAPVARDEAERFAALVRILVAPRTPSAIVDAAVEALRPTTADGRSHPAPRTTSSLH